MYGYFSFQVHPHDSPSSHLVIFCATPEPRVDDIVSVLKKHGDTDLAPDGIILLGFANPVATGAIDILATDPRIVDCVSSNTHHGSPPPITVAKIPRDGFKPDEKISTLTWKEISHSGLLTIFSTRRALMVASSTHHFSKPSELHCDRFIRSANALIDGAEITFIAACCLNFVKDTVRHFYCDTGGIAVVAFAIDSLRRRFNPATNAATVNTFGSYEGLENFTFRDHDYSIVLISASTSGGLEAYLLRRESRFRSDQLITLFSIGAREHRSRPILDLEQDRAFRETLGEFKSYDSATCPLCKKGSIDVPMMGDQFIPAKVVTHSVIILAAHHPKWLPRFLKLACGKRILKAFYRSPNTNHATNDVFIDLYDLMRIPGESPFLNRIHRLFNQCLPAATCRLIHLDDPASTHLAAWAAARLNQMRPAGNTVTVVAAKDVQTEAPGNGPAVVIAAAVASGQSLLAVSKILRDLHSEGAIHYLVALSRMESTASFEKLEKNLRMGETGHDYGFSVAERINIPIAGRTSTSVWDEERIFLQDISNTLSGEEQLVIEARIETLRNALGDSVRGLVDDLFWPSKSGPPLVLRRGFVFFPTDLPTNIASQGDVFFTMVSVLHFLRVGDGPSSVLRQTEYEQRVLSPLCFDRFSDGIIQAALLRAATRRELDYSSSPDDSHRMTALIRTILKSSMTTTGEASREFLLALALGRVTLLRKDLLKLCDEFAESETDRFSSVMWTQIKARQLAAV